jgi:hypothetical protein
MVERGLGRLAAHGQFDETECVQLAATDALRSTIVQNTRTRGSNASTITSNGDLRIGPVSAFVLCSVVMVRFPATGQEHAPCQRIWRPESRGHFVEVSTLLDGV